MTNMSVWVWTDRWHMQGHYSILIRKKLKILYCSGKWNSKFNFCVKIKIIFIDQKLYFGHCSCASENVQVWGALRVISVLSALPPDWPGYYGKCWTIVSLRHAAALCLLWLHSMGLRRHQGQVCDHGTNGWTEPVIIGQSDAREV